MVVPQWRPSGALDALQELIAASEEVPHLLARSAGVTVTEVYFLRHLLRGNLGPVELARLVGVTSAAGTGVVDRLESRGHVQRQPHPRDRRRTEVVVTDSARREMVELLAPMFERLLTLDMSFTEDERAVVSRYLKGSVEAIRELRGADGGRLGEDSPGDGDKMGA